MFQTSHRRAILIPSLIWIGIVLATYGAALLRGQNAIDLGAVALFATSPAWLSILLSPFIQKEWAQILVMLSWIALAILGCLFAGFIPLAILFMAAPVIAALFKQEKIVESLIVSIVFSALLYYASSKGVIPASPLSDDHIRWMQQTGIFAILGLILSALFVVSNSKSVVGDANGGTSLRNRAFADEYLVGSILRFNQSGRLVSANREAKHLFDLAPTLKGASLKNLVSGNSSEQTVLDDAVSRVRSINRPAAIRLELSKKDGDPQKVDSYLFPQKDGGVVIHALDRTRDETRIEALRQEYEAISQGTDDKTLFFAGVSHELRTPLNAIIGFSDMMRSRLFGPLPSKYAEYADLIHDSGQHMLDLIGDVLDLSKVEAGKYTLQYDTFDAADVIRSSVKMVRPAADAAEVTLIVAIDADDSLLVEADRKAVRQMLLNLLSNAIKFSKKGGQVIISSAHKEGFLVIDIQDFGQGMSAEDLEQIGSPYIQTASGLQSDERGSGLGLSLVKSLTELHSGKFDIKSRINEGTRVRISLPLTRL